ncbi:MAG: hemolysin III [Gemmatimonadota bacterium]|nr:MAG: hemolysin III [Gemmatimonadota bacterium]
MAARRPVERTSSPDEPFSFAEEVAHSLTHGAGLLLAVAALVLLVVFASRRGTAIHVVSGAVYGTTLVLLYAASTFYHALPHGRAKRVFGILDHAAIFLLIAGTYTPFALVTLPGSWGWPVFGIIWGLAIAGVLLEAISRGRARRLQLALYLAMGWAIVVVARPLVQGLAPQGLVLLLAGGLAYTLGTVFFVWRRLPFHHAVWHVFVLGGSVCHFFAILLYVIPSG